MMLQPSATLITGLENGKEIIITLIQHKADTHNNINKINSPMETMKKNAWFYNG